MTDWPESVREYEEWKESSREDYTLLARPPRHIAAAAISDLKAMVEELGGLYDSACEQRDKFLADAEKAEAEARNLKAMVEELDMRLHYSEESYRAAEESRKKAEAEVAAMREADAIIPLNEEQAEAFKALSESIRTVREYEAQREMCADDERRDPAPEVVADAAIRDLKAMVESEHEAAEVFRIGMESAQDRAEKAKAEVARLSGIIQPETDYPEAVREYERRRGEGLCWHERQLVPITDAAIAELQDQRMQLKADIETMKNLLEKAEAKVEKLRVNSLHEYKRANKLEAEVERLRKAGL